MNVDRPSEPLLAWIRTQMDRRGLNTAALADKAGLERTRLRRVLSGSQPMQVDELLVVSRALELRPSDFGLEAPAGGEEEEPDLALAGEEDDDTDDQGPVAVDPWGNQPEQVFRVGFALGCDFLFLADVDALDDSGVPPHVLQDYRDRGRDLPIRLDASYHRYYDPRYDTDGITLTLGFDQLYECRFPWHAVKQVTLFPEPPEAAGEDDDDSPDPDVPHLRLV